jgi:hypothetical protein
MVFVELLKDLQHEPVGNDLEDGCLLGCNARVTALMMEAARTSEMSVNIYQTTRHYNPEDSHLHTCRHENLKSSNDLIQTKL